jgi:hypothetical protein
MQTMPDMTIATFKQIVAKLPALRIERVELFANDPLLHPQILEMIKILNTSDLNSAILTVGASPADPSVAEMFSQVKNRINKDRVGFVFSVDHTVKIASRLLVMSSASPYALKAKTFWDIAPQLKQERIQVRTNTVINKGNLDEIIPILTQVAEIGFGCSFCFVQYIQPKFRELMKGGLTAPLEQEFRLHMKESGFLLPAQINQMILKTGEIIRQKQLDQQGGPFNKFRGHDCEEGNISEEQLAKLRQEILELQQKFGPEIILPNRPFIESLGKNPTGCLELIRQKKFPQLKISSGGQFFFCCDMHDPMTSQWNIHNIGNGEGLLDSILGNPYIWLCTWANPCEFSVNRVRYDTKA